jgi:ABC-type uncharacterized transport system substrate-binding protein
LVESLARPGGNVTGLSPMTLDLSGKRLSLLKEAVPHLSRVAFWSIPQTRSDSRQLGPIKLRPTRWEFHFSRPR